ncbi:MAG: NAD(P)-dependent glycerol-3-phosphate dehydrogenase [Oscillospiraceae bacterium]|nr:NAD(P)-dependent glycerol-3-phosphate dehydrogenase [Oscillospiraceae bacterium]
MNIAVIGSGAWGTALSLVLLENGHNVTLWSFDAAQSAHMQQTRENPMLQGVALPPSLVLTGDLACVRGCDIVITATPSYAVRETAARLAPLLGDGTVLVSVSKGIEQGTSYTLTQVIDEELGGRFPLAALSGPSHAEEVGRGVPTVVVCASKRRQAAELVQSAFMNPRFRTYATSDVVGVELGGALKNVIALCAGVCDGLQTGDNTKAALMTRGLTEIARLGVAMGGRQETFAGLSGVGDLIVTCTSMHSRNRRAGILIGQGVPVADAIAQIGAVVEGYYATAAAWGLAQKHNIEMPIVEAAYGVFYEGKNPHSAIDRLMCRDSKYELENSWIG